MRNCKVIFTKRRNGGREGRTAAAAAMGVFVQNYFAILQSPFCGNAKRFLPLRRSARGRGGRP